MIMSKQVLDRNQMEHLCELGIDTTQATMCWIKQHDDDGTSKDILCMHDEFCYEFSSLDPEPTFTLQDILDLLLQETSPQGTGYSLYIDYQEMRIAYCFVDRDGMCWLEPTFDLRDNELIDAAYEMLCWCIENGYVRTESN